MAKEPKTDAFNPIGVTGLNVYSGYINEEFLRELTGIRGMRTFKEMSHNDDTIGAILFAIDLLTRTSDWQVEAADDTPEAMEAAEFLESIMGDMEITWQDFLSEVRTAMVYGWAWFEVILKRRLGPDQKRPERLSKFTDGKIGVRKLAIRSQDSLDHWDLSDEGDILAMIQSPLTTAGQFRIPFDRSLLFRTTATKNNPEGLSILRSAYESWYYLKHIRGYESVGIERELAGLPVMEVPSQLIKSTDTGDVAALAIYKQLVRDVRLNEQGGAIIPSDTYQDREGKPTNIKQFALSLLSASGQRAIDTSAVINRYQRSIARSVLADFLMLGSDSAGSFAMAENKTNLFLKAIEVFNDQDAQILNRHLVPYIWDFNGLDRRLMPAFKPGPIAPVNLDELGTFIERLSRSGMMIFPDEDTENHLRREGGLPLPEGQALEG